MATELLDRGFAELAATADGDVIAQFVGDGEVVYLAPTSISKPPFRAVFVLRRGEPPTGRIQFRVWRDGQWGDWHDGFGVRATSRDEWTFEIGPPPLIAESALPGR